MMMKLVKNLKSLDEHVTAKQNNKIYFNDELYFFKLGDEDALLNELVAEELAKEFGIKCAHYEIGTLCGKPVVISKSVFESGANVYSLLNLVGYEVDLETLWNKLEQNYDDFDVVAGLMEEIVSVFLFDILIANDDRHGLNLFIEECKDGPIVAPIFDNEKMLSELSISHQMYIMNTEPVNNLDNHINILDHFLRISDSRYAKILKDKLWIISEDNIKRVLEKIEKERSIVLSSKYKKKVIDGFKANEAMIQRALEKVNIMRI